MGQTTSPNRDPGAAARRAGRTTPDRPIPVDEADHRSTRERLLDAAEQLFADRGFADTSVRDLTAAADCNIASVNYHFGSKENLYIEVFRRAISEMREHRIATIERQLADPKMSPASLVRAFSESFVDPIVRNPQRGERWMQMYSREMAQPLLPEDMFDREMIEPVAEVVHHAFRRLYPGISQMQVTLILLSVVGQLLHLVQMMRCPIQSETSPVKRIEVPAAIDHVVRFSVAGIEATVGEKGNP